MYVELFVFGSVSRWPLFVCMYVCELCLHVGVHGECAVFVCIMHVRKLFVRVGVCRRALSVHT